MSQCFVIIYSHNNIFRTEWAFLLLVSVLIWELPTPALEFGKMIVSRLLLWVFTTFEVNSFVEWSGKQNHPLVRCLHGHWEIDWRCCQKSGRHEPREHCFWCQGLQKGLLCSLTLPRGWLEDVFLIKLFKRTWSTGPLPSSTERETSPLFKVLMSLDSF